MSGDLAIPMYLNNISSFGVTQTYEDLWRQRVLSVLCTPKGTRAMRPYFGTAAQSVLFENYSTARGYIAGIVGSAFSDYLPELTLQTVEVAEGDDGALVVDIWYQLPNGVVGTTTMSANPSTYGLGA